MWGENKYLELQEWEDFINSNKTIILAINMLVRNKNPQGYIENFISFITSAFVESVTIIDWPTKIKLYVC